MIAVIFEAMPHPKQKDAYLDAAARLRPQLEKMTASSRSSASRALPRPARSCRFRSGEDEEAVRRWRNVEAHRHIQADGRKRIFADYRLRVAQVLRDYGLNDRAQAPEDSRDAHGG